MQVFENGSVYAISMAGDVSGTVAYTGHVVDMCACVTTSPPSSVWPLDNDTHVNTTTTRGWACHVTAGSCYR